MPNWVQNHEIFLVPNDNLQSFLSDIRGPEEWPFPVAMEQLHLPEISAHSEALIYMKSEYLARKFKEKFGPFGWPEWMKPSREQVALMLAKEDYNPVGKIVPLSFPRLLPWRDLDEMEKFFPDADPDSPFHCFNPSEDCGPIAFRISRIGVKWPPSAMSMSDPIPSRNDLTAFRVSYMTPWSVIDYPFRALNEVLSRHGARNLCLWVEEQGFCGFRIHDPENDLFEEHDFSDSDFLVEDKSEEDKYEDYRFDRKSFVESVLTRVDDRDFWLAKSLMI